MPIDFDWYTYWPSALPFGFGASDRRFWMFCFNFECLISCWAKANSSLSIASSLSKSCSVRWSFFGPMIVCAPASRNEAGFRVFRYFRIIGFTTEPSNTLAVCRRWPRTTIVRSTVSLWDLLSLFIVHNFSPFCKYNVSS